MVFNSMRNTALPKVCSIICSVINALNGAFWNSGAIFEGFTSIHSTPNLHPQSTTGFQMDLYIPPRNCKVNNLHAALPAFDLLASTECIVILPLKCYVSFAFPETVS